jgi:hypothetical protein
MEALALTATTEAGCLLPSVIARELARGGEMPASPILRCRRSARPKERITLESIARHESLRWTPKVGQIFGRRLDGAAG